MTVCGTLVVPWDLGSTLAPTAEGRAQNFDTKRADLTLLREWGNGIHGQLQTATEPKKAA